MNDPSEAFEKLKPICFDIVSNCKPSDFIALRAKVNLLDDLVLFQIHDFLLFPCLKALKDSQRLNDCLAVEDLITIKYILSRLNSLAKELTLDFLSHLPALSFPTPASEEIRILILDILKIILSRTLLELGNPACQPVLAHLISMCLYFVEFPGSVSIKVNSLHLLCTIISKLGNPDRPAQFLPGLISNLVKYLRKNSNANHRIIVLIFELAGLSISSCLSDSDCLDFFSLFAPTTLLALQPPVFSAPKNELLVRTKDWHAATAFNLSKVLPFLFSFRSHPHLAVRNAVFNCCILLAQSCSQSLQCCRSSLVESVLFALSDIDTDFRSRCFSQVKRCFKDKVNSAWFSICMENSLSELVLKFNDLIQQDDDTKKLHTLMMLSSHILVMEENCRAVIETGMEEIILGLIWLLSPEVTNVKLIQETVRSGFDVIGKSTVFPERHFAHFVLGDVMRSVQELCLRLLSICPESYLQPLLIHLQQPNHQFQAIFLLNQTLNSSDHNLTFALISKYMHLDISRSNPAFLSPEFTIRESNLLIARNSIMLEGISLSLNSLSGEQRRFVMMDGLYLRLEKLGDQNYVISCSAAALLTKFASFNDNEDTLNHLLIVDAPLARLDQVSQLILNNIDYLIDSVSQKLRYITRNPMAPKVLIAAIRVTGAAALVGPLMTDCVDQVMDILDSMGTGGYIENWGPTVKRDTEQGIVIDLFHVLYQLMKIMSESTTIQMEALTVVPRSDDRTKLNCAKYMTNFIMENRRLRAGSERLQESEQTAKEFFNGKNDGRPGESSTREEEESLEKPVVLNQYETLSLSIVQRTLYFLSSDSPRVRARVLDIIACGMKILSHQPASLYPLINKVWPLIMKRCKDPFYYVAIKALFVIKSCAEHGKDFLRKRVEKDVLSQLESILESFKKQAEDAREGKGAALSTFTFDSKKDKNLFQSCLAALESIALHVPINFEFRHRFEVLLMSFFNSRRYGPEIVDRSLAIIRILAEKDLGWIWILTMTCLGSQVAKGKLELHFIDSADDFKSSIRNIVDLFHGAARQQVEELLKGIELNR